MKTINEHEFERICEEVRQESPAVVQNTRETSQRTELLLKAVFQKVCRQLGLDFERQATALKDDYAFALLQTLEEHMEPEFSYSTILDRALLSAAPITAKSKEV